MSAQARIDQLDPETEVGAIISEAHFAKIDGPARGTREAGARIAPDRKSLKIPSLSGQFYAPTVVTNVNFTMTVAREEILGPALSVLTFKTIEEAIELDNNASHGLSTSVWSDDVGTCVRFARSAKAGTVWTNTFMDGSDHPWHPPGSND